MYASPLFRGIAGSCIFVAYVIFESARQFKQVFNNPDFKSILSHYPASVVITPHMFKKVAVPGICIE